MLLIANHEQVKITMKAWHNYYSKSSKSELPWYQVVRPFCKMIGKGKKVKPWNLDIFHEEMFAVFHDFHEQHHVNQLLDEFAGLPWNESTRALIAARKTQLFYEYLQNYPLEYEPAHPKYWKIVDSGDDWREIFEKRRYPFMIYPNEKALRLFEKIKKIRANGKIDYKKTRQRPPTDHSPAELKARNTLRDMISEDDYRRYLTNGFIVVKGNYGLFYQVFHNHRTSVKVYKKGKRFNSLCIHTHDECPPTDHVLNMKLLIENDEDELWRTGNPSDHDAVPEHMVGEVRASLDALDDLLA